MSIYFTCNSRLTILPPENNMGIRIDYISSADIKKSVRDIGDTATVIIPRDYEVKQAFGNTVYKSIFDYIKVGYRATLELGYDGGYNVEFTGYIRKIDAEWPVKLYLDDDLYPLKQGDAITKSWKSITLKDLLLFVLPGYKIDCPALTLSGGWQINKKSRYSALVDIKTQIGFYTRISTAGKEIYCYWPYSFKTVGTYKYIFGVNVKRSDLTYSRKEDVKVRIVAVAPTREGKKFRVVVGNKDNDARVISRNFNYVSSENELKKLADKELGTIMYDGYQGSITGFGYPLTNPGGSLQIIDSIEKDREGTYLIESVNVKYSSITGYERINTLSYKL